MSENTTQVISEIRDDTESVAGAHDKRCKCAECAAKIQERFQPFFMVEWSRAAQVSRPCPKCNKPIASVSRDGFLMWHCWECSAQRAVVTKIFNQGERAFAFAKRDGDEAVVYFHLSRQKSITCNGSDQPSIDGPISNLVIPKEDDRILYVEMQGDKTAKALWWAFESEYHEALKAIEDRHKIRFIWRDGRIPTSRLHEKPKFKTLWEGKSIEELRTRFPESIHPAYDKNYSAKYFESFDPDTEQWVSINDPRLAPPIPPKPTTPEEEPSEEPGSGDPTKLTIGPVTVVSPKELVPIRPLTPEEMNGSTDPDRDTVIPPEASA